MRCRRFRVAVLVLGLAVCLIGGKVQASGGIELAGDVLLGVMPATAAGMTLGYRDGAGALQLGESLALTAGVTTGLKYAIHERRPNGGRYSFPSFHTSVCFSSAEFLRRRYGWEYGLPAYAAASFVAYSRVESRQHHVQDVLAGAAIGVASSYAFTRPYKGWHVQAEVAGTYCGVRLSRSW